VSLKGLIDANQEELEDIIAKFDKRLEKVFKKINVLATSRVANISDIDEVVKFDLIWRSILKDSGYYDMLQRYTNTLDDLQGSLSAVLKEAGLFKTLGKDQIKRLTAIKELQIKGIEQIGIDAGLTLKKGLYNNVLAGKTKANLLEAMSGQLGGTKYASYAKTYANTAINDYRQATLNQRAEVLDGDEDIVWIYDGNDIDDVTRDFCAEVLVANTAYETDEKNELEASPERAWNCRHFFTFVTRQDAVDMGYSVTGVEADKKPEDKPEKDKQRSIADVTKSIDNKLVKAQKDSRYLKASDGAPVTRYRASKKRGDRAKEITSPTNLTGLNKEAINALEGTVDNANIAIASFGVPKIRSIMPNAGNAIATMGDGQLGVNKKWFNYYANPIKTKDLELEVADNRKKQTALSNKLQKMLKKHNLSETGLDRDEIKQYNKIRNELKTLTKNKSLWELDQRLQPISDWKVGDNLTKRPFNSTGFYKSRKAQRQTIVNHECAHQIHQQWGVHNVKQLKNPPLEQALSRLFQNRTVTPTKYASTNHKEWFAESFALYSNGRKDLIDPLLLDLLDKLKRGSIVNGDSLNKWLSEVI